MLPLFNVESRNAGQPFSNWGSHFGLSGFTPPSPLSPADPESYPNLSSWLDAAKAIAGQASPAVQQTFDQSFVDRTLGTGDAIVQRLTFGLVTSVGGPTYDAENRAGAASTAGIIIDVDMALISGVQAAGIGGSTMGELLGGARSAGEGALAEGGSLASEAEGMGGETSALEGECGGANGCFVAGTEVITGTADGSFSTTPIQDIQVGDEVLTRDQFNPTAPLEKQKVTAVFRHIVNKLEDVTLTAADGSIETIQSTTEHPYYVEEMGWVGAMDLKAGEQVMESDGRRATVSFVQMESHPEGVAVYNFTVAVDHTYFVEAPSEVGNTADALWVHNTGNCVELQDEIRWDDKVHRTFTTSEGNVSVTGQEVTEAGNTLHLKDIAVYAEGTDELEIGATQVRQIGRLIAQDAKSRGFAALRVTGVRYSGANFGKLVDLTIDLSKLF